MNFKTIKSLFIIGIFTITIGSFITACEEDGISEVEGEGQSQYYRESQLRNTYSNGITLLNTDFIAATTLLKDVTSTFRDTRTQENLENTRQQWIVVLKIWKQLELYNVGEIEDSFIHFEINRWPTNTDILNGFIDGDATISEAFITGNGSSSKGISAIEYLLYSGENVTETLATFTTATNAERRIEYLKALTENLNTKAKELEQLWESYAPTFYSSLENGLSGSQNQLVNAMITLSEQIVIRKLGNALGEQTGGTIDRTALENYRSGKSLIAIKQNVLALQKAYTGNYNDNEVSIGFDDYLEFILATELNATIKQSFASNLAAIDNFQDTLENTLTTDAQIVLDLQTSLNDLEVLIKVDMANSLGATVTVNSNDGD